MATTASSPDFVLNDRWARLIGIPALALLFGIIYNSEELLRFDGSFLPTLLPPLLFTTTFWEGNRAIFIRMRKRYPSHGQIATRLVWQTLLSIGYTFVATFVLLNLIELVAHEKLCAEQQFFREFALNLIPTLFITSIYESAYFFSEWKKNVQKTEALARENVQSQLAVLKSQVDPHFLFNSLNTLAALIDDDNQSAQKYLEQLADVYRYVLVNKDKTTVSLREELAFVDAYLYLNKTRFRENLRVETQISEPHQRRLVAPLSLQMLVENAIKHNIISKDRPLTIRIFGEAGDWITVENNVQGKSVLEQSTRVGLQNIINRYRHLTSQPVEVQHGDALFTVRIPLLST
ncbi:MAG: histidine kinase [Ferruginibacter sp.]|nr:histidine kinase [Cytophagales bacterium]